MISIKTFYIVGAGLMVFSTIGSIWSAVLNWPLLNNGSKLSTSVGVLFNFLWFGLFLFLYKMTLTEPMQVVNSPEIENLLNDLKNNKEVNNAKKN